MAVPVRLLMGLAPRTVCGIPSKRYSDSSKKGSSLCLTLHRSTTAQTRLSTLQRNECASIIILDRKLRLPKRLRKIWHTCVDTRFPVFLKV